MPQVGNKKFPYTPSGIAQANQEMGRKRNIRQLVGGQTNQRKPFGPGNQRRPIPGSVPLAPRPVKGPGIPNNRRPRPQGPTMTTRPNIPINRRRTY